MHLRTSSTILTPKDPAYFDYKAAAATPALCVDELRALVTLFEADYPDDLMLRELLVLRACNAIARGAVGIRYVFNAGRAA